MCLLWFLLRLCFCIYALPLSPVVILRAVLLLMADLSLCRPEHTNMNHSKTSVISLRLEAYFHLPMGHQCLVRLSDKACKTPANDSQDMLTWGHQTVQTAPIKSDWSHSLCFSFSGKKKKTKHQTRVQRLLRNNNWG